MSADNEILIVRTGKTWRVAQTSMSDEPYQWNPNTEKFDIVPDAFNFYFKNAPTFDDEKSAVEYAFNKVKEIESYGGYVEGGVCQYEWDDEFKIEGYQGR